MLCLLHTCSISIGTYITCSSTNNKKNTKNTFILSSSLSPDESINQSIATRKRRREKEIGEEVKMHTNKAGRGDADVKQHKLFDNTHTYYTHRHRRAVKGLRFVMPQMQRTKRTQKCYRSIQSLLSHTPEFCN